MNLFRSKKDAPVAEEELVSLVEGRRYDASLSKLPASPAAVQLTLSIKGMHCSSCSSAVENSLK